MKILQVIDALEAGGAERVFVDITNILNDNKVNVSVLLLTKDGVLFDQLDASIEVYRLKRVNKYSFKKFKECYDIIRNFDIVHCHTRHVYKYVSLVSKIFNLTTKIIFQDHSSALLSKKEIFLMRYFFKVENYISVSSQRLKWSLEKFSLNAANSYLLENIIRKSNNQTPVNSTYDLILISNFKKNKNNLFAIEIANKLNSNLLLVGRNQDQEYYNKISDAIKEAKHITLNTTITDAQKIIPKAKLGLHTSINETGPIVLIEYLAQNIPFLAYEVGEVSKILKPHFPEYFIDNFDIDKWIIRIKELQSKPADYDKMNLVFDQYFGEKEYYNKINTIYQCVLKN